MASSGLYCYDGNCVNVQPPRVFPSQQSLRQHFNRVHRNKESEESSIGRGIKRKHEAEAAESEERQRRIEEARIAADFARRTPEPTPVPLLEQAVDVDLPRSTRKRRDPARFKDLIPTSTVPSQMRRKYLTKKQQAEEAKARAAALRPEQEQERAPSSENNDGDPSASLESHSHVTTDPDSWGVFRKYTSIPSHNPDDANPFEDLPSSSLHQAPLLQRIGSDLTISVSPIRHESDPFADSENPTADMVVGWWSQGSREGVASLNRLVQVIQNPRFDPSQLKNFNAVSAIRRFEKKHGLLKSKAALVPGDGWKEASVKIRLPCAKVKQREEDAPEFTVEGLLYRDLVEVITTALRDPDSFERMHLKPFEEWWKPSESEDPIRVYSDTYTADVMLEAERHLQDSQGSTPSLGPDLETFNVSVGLYSDSTNLTAFSHAALWPMYMFMGNESKYVRSRPSTFSAHHVAYLPTLPDTIKEAYYNHYGVYPTADVLAHLKRELAQGALRVIFGGSVADAQKNGRITRCADEILRRWFFRLIFHSADYLEKGLLTGMKCNSLYLCPRCLVLKGDVPEVGTHLDVVRRLTNAREYPSHKIEITHKKIFEEGWSVSYKGEHDSLKYGSWTPTLNAYYTELGLDPSPLMAVDLMHDFELGVEKQVLLHLLRIFHAAGKGKVEEFDKRFRQVPTFGRDTIRRFGGSVSALKRPAARSFEDILQCCLPVLEGLLPEGDNKEVLDLAWDMATWHAYAKLRKHTEHTLSSLRSQTKELGRQLRRFVNKVCSAYNTKALPSEEAARVRRRARKAQGGGSTSQQKSGHGSSTRRFNMATYKIHALGDYADHIARFGPTDCFTTQHGELEHRRVKQFYKRTNKGVSFPWQIAKRERLQRHYRKYIKDLKEEARAEEPLDGCQDPGTGGSKAAVKHYKVSGRSRGHLYLYRWALEENSNDPALANFIPDLKDHLLARILRRRSDSEDGVFTENERNQVQVVGRRLEKRFTMTVNYTTYDIRRGSDKINMKGRPYVMALSHDDRLHPYIYARVLGIYRVKVLHPTLAAPTKMDVLWVRWAQVDRSHRAGWKAKRLYRIQFVPSLEVGAFGFMDPEDIVRGSHLIPCFKEGLDKTASVSKWDYAAEANWKYHYINQFVDRDMFMHYRGGGIGHECMRAIESIYENMSREQIHHRERNRPTARSETADPNVPGGADDVESGDEAGPVNPQAGPSTQMSRPAGGTDGDDDDDDDDTDYIPSSDESSSGISDSDDLDSDDCDDYEGVYSLGGI